MRYLEPGIYVRVNLLCQSYVPSGEVQIQVGVADGDMVSAVLYRADDPSAGTPILTLFWGVYWCVYLYTCQLYLYRRITGII